MNDTLAIRRPTRGVLATLLVATNVLLAQTGADWPCVGGDPGAMRYSTLTQIDRDNVGELSLAWEYRTGELATKPPKTIECTPVVADGVMYLTTAYTRVVALDAATGKERWTYDPFADGLAGPLASGGVNRGVAYWSDAMPDGARRVLVGCADGRLVALDARTGRPDPAFGAGGTLDLRAGLDRDVSRLAYGPTSAPAVWKDLVVVGVSTGEGPGVAAPGDIRAFDVRSGAEVWSFRTVPRPGEFGNETWEEGSWRNRGGANAWGGLSVDVRRGLVFGGTGSASFDFYGGDRKGANLFANCTLALDAATGRRRWHFQTIRHDLWDHDLPVYPNLVRVRHDGREIDAVAQVTKTGYVYLFDRETGKPLFDVVEKPVPASDVEGEEAAPTQPIPVKPPPFAAQHFDESNVTDIADGNRRFALEQLAEIRTGPAFLPPSLEGSVVVPGFHGGANWSGASFDPATGLLYVNSTNIANVVTLTPAPAGARYEFASQGYKQLRDQEGYPAIAPPWGQLNAIDLNTGTFRWRVTLGEYPELTARGVPPTGTENFGGSVVTAGGLVFIAGTMDEAFRAFDAATGAVLWQTRLPAGGYATPCTYTAAGRQYVVIAAGGAGKLKTGAGDSFLAFALPE